MKSFIDMDFLNLILRHTRKIKKNSKEIVLANLMKYYILLVLAKEKGFPRSFSNWVSAPCMKTCVLPSLSEQLYIIVLRTKLYVSRECTAGSYIFQLYSALQGIYIYTSHIYIYMCIYS